VAEWDVGFATLVGASSWERDETRVVEDLTPGLGFLVPLFAGSAYTDNTVPFPAKRTLDKFTQEIRLASPSGQRFEWMVGAFYTHESAVNAQPVYALDAAGQLIPGINPFFVGHVPWTYDEIAGFANGTIRFNDRFSLTAGLRYSVNEQNYTATQYGA